MKTLFTRKRIVILGVVLILGAITTVWGMRHMPPAEIFADDPRAGAAFCQGGSNVLPKVASLDGTWKAEIHVDVCGGLTGPSACDIVTFLTMHLAKVDENADNTESVFLFDDGCGTRQVPDFNEVTLRWLDNSNLEVDLPMDAHETQGKKAEERVEITQLLGHKLPNLFKGVRMHYVIITK